ncbi:MAG TPA: hypothetical protein VIE47_08780 [Methylocystis sp.]|jgi:hypothetical protein
MAPAYPVDPCARAFPPAGRRCPHIDEAALRPIEAAQPADRRRDRRDPTRGIAVLAIVRSGDASRTYLVGGGQAGEWYSVGQTIGGWTIAEIRASVVALASGAQSAKVRLYPQSKEQRRRSE